MVNETNLHAWKQIAAVAWNWLLNINVVQIIVGPLHYHFYQDSY